MIYGVLAIICVFGLLMVYEDDIRRHPSMTVAKTMMQKKKTDMNLWIIKNNKSILDKELYNSSVILKNLSIIRRQTPLSADYMYEKLMENSHLLKPLYSQMLTLYRNKKDEDAFKVLPLAVGTKASRSFAIILSKLEKINPAELEEQMGLFQKNMIEVRKTQGIKRIERNGAILTILSTVTVFAVLLNFVVVIVFMSTFEQLENVFL